MLQNQGINKISELKNGFTPTWLEPDFISSSLKWFSFSRLCQVFPVVKLKGYSFEWIMTLLLSMPFIDSATVHSMLSGCVEHHIKAGGYLLPFEEQSAHQLEVVALVVPCQV